MPATLSTVDSDCDKEWTPLSTSALQTWALEDQGGLNKEVPTDKCSISQVSPPVQPESRSKVPSVSQGTFRHRGTSSGPAVHFRARALQVEKNSLQSSWAFLTGASPAQSEMSQAGTEGAHPHGGAQRRSSQAPSRQPPQLTDWYLNLTSSPDSDQIPARVNPASPKASFLSHLLWEIRKTVHQPVLLTQMNKSNEKIQRQYIYKINNSTR